MPSRLGKFWRDSLKLAAVFTLVCAPRAWATLNLTVGNFGSLATVNGSSTIYYSTVVAPSGPLLFYAPYPYRNVVPNLTYTNDLPSGGTAMPNALQIGVTPTQSENTPAGSTLFLGLQVSNTGTTATWLPIAGYAAGTAAQICVNNPCSNFGNLGNYVQGQQSAPDATYYGGVAFSGSETIVLFVYPGDICASLVAQGAAPTFCTGGAITSQPGVPAIINFEAVLVSAPVNNYTSAPTSLTAVDNSAPTRMSFQSDVVAENCNSVTPPTIYPGDSQIQVDTTQFGLATVTSGASPVSSSEDAPATQMFVLGALGTAPVTTTNGFNQNAIYAPLSLNGQVQSVNHFVNTTPTQTNTYDVDFLVQDATGMVVTGFLPDGTTPCNTTLNTYQIFGFLNASHCFIATAAFRDADVAPVRMLRTFRDRILLANWAGRKFVDLYYRFSPPAAEWLVENPVFRYPVLLALIPIEIVAWIALHSVTFLFLGSVAFALLVFAAAIRVNYRRGVE